MDERILNGSGRGPIRRELIERVRAVPPLMLARVIVDGYGGIRAVIDYGSDNRLSDMSVACGGATAIEAAENLKALLIDDLMGRGSKPQYSPHFGNYDVHYRLLARWEREGPPADMIVRPRIRVPPGARGKSPRHGFVCKHRPHYRGNVYGGKYACYTWEEYELILDCVFEMADQVSAGNGITPEAAVDQVCNDEGWRLLPRHKRAIIERLKGQ